MPDEICFLLRIYQDVSRLGALCGFHAGQGLRGSSVFLRETDRRDKVQIEEPQLCRVGIQRSEHRGLRQPQAAEEPDPERDNQKNREIPSEAFRDGA